MTLDVDWGVKPQLKQTQVIRPEMVTDLLANQFIKGEDGVELDVIQGNAYFVIKLNSSVRQDHG